MSEHNRAGWIAALPAVLLLTAGFVLPILLVVTYSFMPSRTFGLDGDATLTNWSYPI